jgi:nucleoid-associated protein YgaU
VSGSVAIAAAASAPAPPPPTAVRDGRTDGLTSLPAESPPATTTTRPAPTGPAVATPPNPGIPPPSSTTVVVSSGDNLWEISASHLAAASARARIEVPDGEIAPYWALVCETNRPTLQSGDPNLIFPGEVVRLPPVH